MQCFGLCLPIIAIFQWQSIKNVSDYQNAHFLPSLHVIAEEKTKCLPDNIEITENEASVPLDDMMEKTFDRHMEDEQFRKNVERVHKKNGEEILNLEAYYKLGYDCASGQSQFKVSCQSKKLKKHPCYILTSSFNLSSLSSKTSSTNSFHLLSEF